MSVSLTTPPPAFGFSADLLRVVFTCADYAALKNYAIRFRLFIALEGSEDELLIYDTRLPVLPGTAGEVHAYIGDKLHDHISADIDLHGVEYPDGPVLHCTRSCRAYHFEFAESYGEDIEDQAAESSPTYTILHGGLSYRAQALASLQALITPATAAYDRFLSQDPARASVVPSQPVYLYFFNSRETVAGAQLRIAYRYADGSYGTGVLATFEMLASGKYAFDVSLGSLSPEAGKTLAGYEVSLWSGSNRRSEVRTFAVDYRHRDFVRCFMHWSSWGTLDTKVCVGQGASGLELTQKTSGRILSQGFDIRGGQRTVYDVRGTSMLSVATGWLDRVQRRLFRDFFLSRLKYRLHAGVLMPIMVDTESIEDPVDGQPVGGIAFDYRYLYEEHAYTEGDLDEPGIHFDGFTFTENVEWSGLTDGSGAGITDNDNNQIIVPQ